jgi:predicted SAM-dependent methyltransferase
MTMMNNLKIIKSKLIRMKIFFIRLWWRMLRNIVRPEMPMNEDGKVYVNLGCGANTSGEFINVDTVVMPHMHFISDITQLNMFPDNSVDLIYASHVLEHIPRSRLKKTLKEWHRALKPGGVFRFAVPDFDRLIEVYMGNSRNVESIINQVMGSEGEYDDHHTLWNFEFAREILKGIGFKDVKTWDYQNADHHGFVDKSSRIMKTDKDDILISLNLEATK